MNNVSNSFYLGSFLTGNDVLVFFANNTDDIFRVTENTELPENTAFILINADEFVVFHGSDAVAYLTVKFLKSRDISYQWDTRMSPIIIEKGSVC